MTRLAKSKHRTYAASFLRQLVWSGVAYMLGGVTLTGNVPSKPGIVVVNHSSHADTAVLFSILHWRTKPFVLAAKDYWDSGLKRFVANSVVATVMIDRSGGRDAYEALKETVADRLSRGELVILFPEGTRTVSGEVGEFKSGAVRLASDLQVPLYPTALKGLYKLLPKHGILKPRRMEISFGEPVMIPEALKSPEVKAASIRLREQIVALKGKDIPEFRLQRPFN